MNLQLLSPGLVLLGTGIPMLFFARRSKSRAEAASEARLAELRDGAGERYFEEQRTIEAYPPLKSEARYRFWGAALVGLGAMALVMAFLDRS